MRSLAPIVNPVLAALPAAQAGAVAFVDGVLWSSDGKTWIPVGQQQVTLLSGRATIDVGTVPQPEFFTTVTDPKVTTGSRVRGWISDIPPAGKDADEMEMDAIDVWCRVAGDGQLYIRLICLTGCIADKFVIDYLITKG